MRVVHVKPEGWADTEERRVIQPSHVAGMVHQVELVKRGIFGAGPKGETGAAGARAKRGHGGVFRARFAPLVGWCVMDPWCRGRLIRRCLRRSVVFGAGDGVSTFRLPDLRGSLCAVWTAGAALMPGA